MVWKLDFCLHSNSERDQISEIKRAVQNHNCILEIKTAEKDISCNLKKSFVYRYYVNRCPLVYYAHNKITWTQLIKLLAHAPRTSFSIFIKKVSSVSLFEWMQSLKHHRVSTPMVYNFWMKMLTAPHNKMWANSLFYIIILFIYRNKKHYEMETNECNSEQQFVCPLCPYEFQCEIIGIVFCCRKSRKNYTQ